MSNNGDDHPIHETVRRHRAERVARLGLLRRWLRHLPRRSNVGRYPVLRWFADAARQRPFLWTFRPPGPRRAVYVGSILALLPLYGLQIALALVAAIVFRANLAILVALQAMTNPLTAGPIYFATHRIGRFLIDVLGLGSGEGGLASGVNALVVGGLAGGLLLGGVLDLVGRFLAWEARQLRRRHTLAHLESERILRRRDGEEEEPGTGAPGAGEPGSVRPTPD